jgi:hypothetical protein
MYYLLYFTFFKKKDEKDIVKGTVKDDGSGQSAHSYFRSAQKPKRKAPFISKWDGVSKWLV